jgi:hypothetical protein
MADRKERRFLLLAGQLVLASWAAVGWCAATAKPWLYLLIRYLAVPLLSRSQTPV